MALNAQQKSVIHKTLPAARIFFDFSDRSEYTKDATEMVFLPDALFMAETEDELVRAVRLCRQIDLPLIIRGAGTGYSGGALAVRGGLLISIEKIDEIKIDTRTKTAVVGPGAITGDIMKAAEKKNLFYPPDPASFEESCIGGNLAENAGGLRCKKYGVTKDYVLACRGIDARGKIVEIDHSSPFGLLDLMIGSEGTLFIFSEITLRLIDLPRPGNTLQAVFDDTVDAASVVAEVTAAGIVPCIMEFMDGDAIACSNRYDPDHRIEEGAAMLLFETDGAAAEDETAAIMAICEKYAAVALRLADDPETREHLWQTRRNLSKAVKSAYKSKISEDVCVPPSRLPQLVAYVSELAKKLPLRVNCYGHAGDGNLHVNFLGQTGDEMENQAITEGVELLFDKTLALGGTLTGEHGIGITKKDYMGREFGPSTMRCMHRLKKCLDPENLVNPGKIFA